ncbi:AraC family transcriptional regulator ligand-binding domain-containing protein [Streptomyces phaeofaciens]|uniref:AraC family transcriptional regulator ligand-binding domain-containing protein n=1 Tax=Streptomyces phaeofaciens TaxID=68254 RepID=UPI00367E5A8D
MRPPPAQSPRPTWAIPADLGLATAHRLLGLVIRSGYRPRAVLLPHAPAAPSSSYVRFFGAEVRPERTHGALIIDGRLMDVPLQDVDETIRRVATSYLDTNFRHPATPRPPSSAP